MSYHSPFPSGRIRCGRRLCRLGIVVLVLAACSLSVHAQTDSTEQGQTPPTLEDLQASFRNAQPQPSSSAELVEVAGSPAPVRLAPGEAVEAAVVLRVAEGWHINAHEPLQDFLIGTALLLSAPEGLSVLALRYPEPRLARFAFATEALAVYEGTTSITFRLRAVADGMALWTPN